MQRCREAIATDTLVLVKNPTVSGFGDKNPIPAFKTKKSDGTTKRLMETLHLKAKEGWNLWKRNLPAPLQVSGRQFDAKSNPFYPRLDQQAHTFFSR